METKAQRKIVFYEEQQDLKIKNFSKKLQLFMKICYFIMIGLAAVYSILDVKLLIVTALMIFLAYIDISGVSYKKVKKQFINGKIGDELLSSGGNLILIIVSFFIGGLLFLWKIDFLGESQNALEKIKVIWIILSFTISIMSIILRIVRYNYVKGMIEYGTEPIRIIINTDKRKYFDVKYIEYLIFKGEDKDSILKPKLKAHLRARDEYAKSLDSYTHSYGLLAGGDSNGG